MNLLPGERKLVEGGNGVLTLTTHRVRFDGRGSGGSQLVSITLDAVASCGLVTKTNPFLVLAALIIGGLALVFARQLGSWSGYGLVLAVVLAIAYLLTRAGVLSIASAGETILANVKGMDRKAIVEFVDAVEEAKLTALRERGRQSAIA